jgi:hypothetical protein
MKADDETGGTRWMGTPPPLSVSELVCLAVAQALLGYHSEARWLRHTNKHLSGMFPYLPQRPGYNKRLRSAIPLLKRMIRELAMDSDFWFDNHWIVDSTPVPCGMSRPTVRRSNVAGWVQYGYCASHSPVLLGASPLPCPHSRRDAGHVGVGVREIGEREVLSAMLEVDASLIAAREGILLSRTRASRPNRSSGSSSIKVSNYYGLRASARRSGTASRCSRRSAS